MNINLHIERLVLDAAAASLPAQLEAALATELTRLLGVGGLPTLLRQGGIVPVLRASPVATVTDSAAMGAVIGRAVHLRLSRDSGTTSS